MKTYPRLVLTLILGTALPAMAQNVSEEEEEIFTLSPFTITADDDSGYRSTSTLSGTRIKTEMRNLGTSIQAVTEEFLEDTGVTEITELLLYTTSTEVSGGAGGNYTDALVSTAGPRLDNLRRQETVSNRVRGISNATLSRNLFGSVIPFDSYNVSRVEINRGANSVLFGLGSPAGIINSNLSEAMWKNQNEVELRVDEYGSWRGVLDINRVIAKDKLALRLSALSDNQEYKQDPAFRDDHRIFVTGTYKPFKSTTISANYEKGSIDSTLPRFDPPKDYFTWWWPFGKVSIPPNTDWRDAPPEIQYVQFGSNIRDVMHVYDNPNSSGTGNAFIQYPSDLFGRGIINPATSNPARVDDFRYRTWSIQNSRELLANIIGDPEGVNMYPLNLIDSTVYDFFNNTIDGNASFQYGEIEAYNAALRQEFLEGKIGVELSFDHQSYDSGHHDALDGLRGNSLQIDLNASMLAYLDPSNPDAGLAPNPNYLRPFIGSRGNWVDRTNEAETIRATAYLSHDFSEKNEGLLWNILGRHDLTLLYSDREANFTSLNSGTGAFMDYDQLVALGWSTSNARANQYGQLTNIFYLAGPLGDANTYKGLNIPGYKGNFVYPDKVNVNYITEDQGIASASIDVLHYDNQPHTRIAQGANISQDNLETMAAVLHSQWLNGGLVTTFGWRNDKVTTYGRGGFSRRPDNTVIYENLFLDTSTPTSEGDKSTSTYGGVIRVNKLLEGRLDLPVELDLHYAWSENFQGLDGVRSVDGGFFPAPEGETTELGFSMGLFNNKLFFRANWFETSQNNLLDDSITESISTIINQIPPRVYQEQTVTELNAAGWALPPMILEPFEITVSPPDETDHATYTVNQGGGREINSVVSKGFELEATYNILPNWRMAVNVSKVKAVESGKGTHWADTVDWVAANWLNNPSVAALKTDLDGILGTVGGFTEQRAVTSFRSALERDGASNPEIREWRVNLITNYTFAQDSFLKGFGVGGGVRYQDEVFLGFVGKNDPANPDSATLIADVTKPIYGPSETNYDFWISYRRPLFDGKVGLKLQLNIRNAFSNNDLIPYLANPADTYSKYSQYDDYRGVDYSIMKIAAPRTIELRTIFTF